MVLTCCRCKNNKDDKQFLSHDGSKCVKTCLSCREYIKSKAKKLTPEQRRITNKLYRDKRKLKGMPDRRSYFKEYWNRTKGSKVSKVSKGEKG